MTEFTEIELAKRLNAFKREYHRIEPYINGRRELTADLKLREEYKNQLVETYNSIAEYLKPFSEVSVTNYMACNERIDPIVTKIKACFFVLKLKYNWADSPFQSIVLEQIRNLEPDTKVRGDQPQSDELSGGSSHSDIQGDQSKSNQVQGDPSQKVQGGSSVEVQGGQVEEIQNIPSTNNSLEISDDFATVNGRSSPIIEDNGRNLIQNSREVSEIKMPQTPREFMSLAGPILNYKFDGNPLKLETFLTDIELVESLCEDETKDLCFKFIKSKLEGRALEAMPEGVATIKQITDALKSKIKPDPSKVIEGKIASLRLVKGNFSAFSKQAEELAEALRRSLVIEGIAKAKAEEMSIQKMVDLCRKTAINDVVKSVISSTHFNTPAECIAKFITESDVAKQEYQTRQKNSNQNKNKNNGKKPWNKGKGQNSDNQGQNQGHNSGGGYRGGKKGGKFQPRQHQNDAPVRQIQGNTMSPPESGQSTSQQQPQMVYQFMPNQ